MIPHDDKSSMHDKVRVHSRFSRRVRQIPVRFTQFKFLQGSKLGEIKYLYRVAIADGFLVNHRDGLQIKYIDENGVTRYFYVSADGTLRPASSPHRNVGNSTRWWFADQPDPEQPETILL